MPATLEDVRTLIQDEFSNADVSEVKEERHRISGIIRWQGFRGKSIQERNQLVTQKVRDRLGLRGMNIDILFPLTPGERL